MRKRVISILVLVWNVWLASCVETGQDRVDLPLFLAGTEVSEPFLVRNDWRVQLQVAQLAFGPLYLCAGAQAGELCDVARAEWRHSAVVDALSPEPAAAGDMQAVTGFVRSWMYDLGFVSLLTQQQVLTTEAAAALGGHSVRLQGDASDGITNVPFTVNLSVQQSEDTEQGVPIVRSSTASGLDHEIAAGDSLLIRFDPRPWLAAIDFDELATANNCAGSSCTSVLIADGSQAARAIRQQLLAGERPNFEWLPMDNN